MSNLLKPETVFIVLLCITVASVIIITSRTNNSKCTIIPYPRMKNCTMMDDPVFPKISIGLIARPRPSCTCTSKSAVTLKDFVSKDQLNDVIKRRAEEYRQHQIRTKTDLDLLLLAPSNSPLQYPIQGFTAVPIKKNLIPGLAVHARGRRLYKVSLSVGNGVLAVEDLAEGDRVEGQEQNVLSLSATSAGRLNELLERVSYTSTLYHIKTGDLAHFKFEDHEAVFPIVIKRPSIPVLYDPGNDVNSQVTIVTKTFLRYKELKILIDSIRKYYKDIKIIIADDSLKPEKVDGPNIEQYIMPPAQGWFAGRNLGISQVTTKYFLWVDDDFLFESRTRIEKFVEVMEAVPELDVVGGTVIGDQYSITLDYKEGDDAEGGCLTEVVGRSLQALPGFNHCSLTDGVVNFFLGRTDSVRSVGFDPALKRVAHYEFFVDGLGQLLVATCKGINIGHQRTKKEEVYKRFRDHNKKDMQDKLARHFFKNYFKCVQGIPWLPSL